MESEKDIHSKNCNVTNIIIGFTLGLCVILAIGATGRDYNSCGKYQCCAAGDDSYSVFILDTQTGQTWRLSRTDIYDFGTPQAPRSIRQSITPIVR